MFRKPLILTVLVVFTFIGALSTSNASVAPSANLIYTESDLGGGNWKYDYTFYNTSSANEYLYSVDLLFDQWANVNGMPLPSGWDSTVWEGPNYTDFIVSFSNSGSYDISNGSSLGGFSFTIDYQAGSIPFNAYFDDHQGGITSSSGYTVTPEPISSTLFLSGGVLFFVRNYIKKTKQKRACNI
jgi:hypothetical protein